MSIKTLKKLEEIAGERLTLGKAIWALRSCDEVSQNAFSKILGVSRQYLCDLEHNRKEVSAKKAAEFAHKLGHSERQFIRLAIQDTLARQGLMYNIELRDAA